MKESDSGYILANIVEIDDTFFGGPTRGGKRGRGTEKTPVLAAISVNDKGSPHKVKMKVVKDIKSSTIIDFVNSYIWPGTRISSDAYHSYRILKTREDYEYHYKEYDPQEDPGFLKWLHTTISNAKSFVAGTYHGLDSKHLQAYLDEFCYRFNRRWRHNHIFNSLLNACINADTVTYAELTG